MENWSENGHHTRAVQATLPQSFTALSTRSRGRTLDAFHGALHIATPPRLDVPHA